MYIYCAAIFVAVASPLLPGGAQDDRATDEHTGVDSSYTCTSCLPLAGAPSMTSYLMIVSLSLYWLDPVPAVSLRIIAISMCLILILTKRK